MKKIILSLILLGISCLFYAFFIEPYWIQEVEITIEDKDIPKSFNNKRIVFISDIHHWDHHSIERVENLVIRINKLNPDIIILWWDYIYWDKKYIIPVFDTLSKLKAPLWIFWVSGNHDHWEWYNDTINNMSSAWIIPIDNHSEWISINWERIKIWGVPDLWEWNPDILSIEKDAKESDFAILVSHNPDFVEELESTKIDLMLSGHTHWWQVTLFWLYAPLIPSRHWNKYRSWIIETNTTKLIVTNGIWTMPPALRFFARPQINIITLKSEK